MAPPMVGLRRVAGGEPGLEVGDITLREGDVPLLQFAAVVAAVGEAVALPLVLELEGLTQTMWAEASRAWGARIATDAAARALYGDELALAEDRLARTVAPLDRDFEAWLGLHALWRGHAEPARLLDDLGLRAADMARLRRRWGARVAPAPRLAGRVREAESRPEAAAKAPPPLTLGETVLRPSAAAGLARSTPAPELDTSATASVPGVLMMSLDEYARACALLDDAAGPGLAGVLRAFRLPSEAAWERAERAWRRELAREPQLAADFRALRGHFASRKRAHAVAAQSPAAPPPRPWAAPMSARAEAVDVTAFAPALSDEPALPFARRRGPVVILPVAEALAPSPDAGATSDTNPILRDAEVLPFGVPRADVGIDVTAQELDAALLDLDELPFAGVHAPPALAPPVAEARSHLTAAIPMIGPVPGASLTAEQYASLCAELAAAAPALRPVVLHRYGVAPEAATALNREWRCRFDRDHELRERWYALYSGLYRYLTGA
jgi:hypothetical protein